MDYMTINKDLTNRIKSFLWRTLGMFIGGGVTYIASNISSLDLPETFAILGYSVDTYVVVGLIIGEITKQVNNVWGIKKS
jgi:hypothetical protein